MFARRILKQWCIVSRAFSSKTNIRRADLFLFRKLNRIYFNKWVHFKNVVIMHKKALALGDLHYHSVSMQRAVRWWFHFASNKASSRVMSKSALNFQFKKWFSLWYIIQYSFFQLYFVFSIIFLGWGAAKKPELTKKNWTKW